MDKQDLDAQKGQSIILVAVAIVALVLFVAIAVDVSSAYYQRRTDQNAADGAALAGVSRMAFELNKKNPNMTKVDAAIRLEMVDFAQRNGVQDTDGNATNAINTNVEGWYVDGEGNRLPGEPKVGAQPMPAAAYGVEAITHIVAPTFFGGIFGLHGLPLNARAVSLLKLSCGSDCVVPITTDVSLLQIDDGEGHLIPNIGACFNIWRENQNEVPTPGLYGWVNWTWQEAMCELDPKRPCPSVVQGKNACDSPTLARNLDPTECASGFVQVGDWMSSTSGVINADDVLCWLCYYLGPAAGCLDSPCMDGKAHEFTIPVYDGTTLGDPYYADTTCLRMKDPTDPTTGGLHYRVAGFARMQLQGFRLSQGASGSVSAGDSGSLCVTLGTGPHEGNRITAQFLQYVDEFDPGSACYDPEGTLLSAPRLTQ
jgi:Flp pilus assembly protein TadG